MGIPVRDGGAQLAGVLRALAAQTVQHELVVCDSGSRDGSVGLARERGAQVLEIAPERFTHGGVRNLLMERTTGRRVALLTQDAEPADERWLERLLGGFELADDVGIAYGPYIPRPSASPAVRLELEAWFRSLSPEGEPTVERLSEDERERGLQPKELVGRRGFFTDANACVSREAWGRVPFREVPYAEDRVLALDMLRGGYAKVFVPQAGVIHSHDYTTLRQLRRSFDEWRGLLEVYGWREPASLSHLLSQLRGELGRARTATPGSPTPQGLATLGGVTRHHLASRAGALLGSRSDRLPERVRRGLSLEGRGGFSPLGWEASDVQPTGEDRQA